MCVHKMYTKSIKGITMLEQVKKELANQKEKLDPISLRIESSSKTAMTILAASYDVKTNELIRIILKSFIQEAINEPLNADNILKNLNQDISFETLGDLLDFMYPEINPNTKTIKRGFKITGTTDMGLGD